MARLDKSSAMSSSLSTAPEAKAQSGNAYRLAGYAPNDSHASDLANLPTVKLRTAEIVGIVSARAEASAERVLAELARLGFSDVTQAIEIKRGHVKIRDTQELSADVKAAISEIRQGRDGVTVKFHDKGRALELLGKHLGLFKENVNIDVNISLADLVNGSYKLEQAAEVVDVTPNQQVSTAEGSPSLPDTED